VVRRWLGEPGPRLRGPLGRTTRPSDRRRCGRARRGSSRRLTYRELRERSDALAGGLRATGRSLSRDAVGIFLPPIPDAVVAVMACSKLGAIWLPSVLGVRRRRRGQAARRCRRGRADHRRRVPSPGRPVPMKETADEAVALAPVGRRVVVVERSARADAPWDPQRDVRWDELCPNTPAHSRPSAWTRSTRCSSRTRAARPARPRAPSTSTAASWSRSPRRSRTRPTSVRRRPVLGRRPRLDHGALGDRGRDRRSAPRSSCTTGRRTIPGPTGSGTWSSDTASRSSASPPRSFAP
jgi:hypothetical protein